MVHLPSCGVSGEHPEAVVGSNAIHDIDLACFASRRTSGWAQIAIQITPDFSPVRVGRVTALYDPPFRLEPLLILPILESKKD